jgi:SAM-dependent methyltransferase
MFAFLALCDTDKAALAAAHPSPMRAARPLVMSRVLDAVIARLGCSRSEVARGAELGCGSGRLCRLAAQLLPGAEIVGVDASPYMVAWANVGELAAPDEVGLLRLSTPSLTLLQIACMSIQTMAGAT